MEKMVVKYGKIFQAGDYPDKKFKLTAEELPTTVSKFASPVPLDLTHKKTVARLDAKLGSLTQIAAGKNGQLYGRVEIPEWLDNLVGKDDEGNPIPFGVSCAFGKDKSIVKLAITDTPRVQDAAVFAAFSEAHPEEELGTTELAEEVIVVDGGEVDDEFKRFSENPADIPVSLLVEFAAEFARKHNTSEGQSVLQQIHDVASRSGAICNKPAEFHAAHELKGFQSIHDATVSHGAKCSAVKEGTGTGVYFDEEHPMETPEVTQETKVRFYDSFRDGFAALFSSGKAPVAPVVEAPPGPPVVVPPSAEFTAQLAAAQAAQVAAETEATRLREETIATQAAAFATEVITAGKETPANREIVEGQFAQALRDDVATSVEIQFSADMKGGRVDAIRAIYANKPAATNLTQEELDAAATAALLSADEPAAGEPDKVALAKARALELAVKLNKKINRNASS